MGDEVTMVSEERAQRYREHEGHKEREHYVVAPGTARRAEITLDKILNNYYIHYK